MQPHNDTFFELKLNEDGIARLRQVLVITRWLIIIGFVQMGVFIADTVVRYITIHAFPEADNFYSWLMRYFYPVYAVLYAFFFIALLIYFFNYARRSNQSILRQDTVAFNRSYKFLASALRMLVVTEVLNLVIFTVFFILELGYYKNLD
jgi:hypothetical protein